jgi:hypothetical protein
MAQRESEYTYTAPTPARDGTRPDGPGPKTLMTPTAVIILLSVHAGRGALLFRRSHRQGISINGESSRIVKETTEEIPGFRIRGRCPGNRAVGSNPPSPPPDN